MQIHGCQWYRFWYSGGVKEECLNSRSVKQMQVPGTKPRWRLWAGAAGKALLQPSLADVFFLVLLIVAFGRTGSLQALLSDGDTGWHIRTGQFILSSGTVPAHDLFSFSRAGQPWFAWEWGADVIFALLFRWHGLEAVAAFTAVILSLAALLLLCWLLRRGVGLWIALAVVLAVVSASSIHYLARPHVFSLLFLTTALWLLDEDRRRATRAVWLLVPLTALWANFHGGFVAWFAVLGILLATEALQHHGAAVRRYGALAGLCALSTLLNPYGWRLHEHILRYLTSSWILDNVQEFQSPRIRSESTLVFAALLLIGVALASRSLARRQWFEGCLVLVWGFAALRSARHIPLFAVVAAPVVATECALWWVRAAAQARTRSVRRVFWELGQDLGRSRRASLWMPALGALALAGIISGAPVTDFPKARFPVEAVARNLDRLTRPVHVLTSDQWADYLIYRLYPRQRVFFDGRSDFYGPSVGADYQALLSATRRWRMVLDEYAFQVALVPADWPLNSLLANDPQWRDVYHDSVAHLFVRQPSGLKENARSVEGNQWGNEVDARGRVDGNRVGDGGGSR